MQSRHISAGPSCISVLTTVTRSSSSSLIVCLPGLTHISSYMTEVLHCSRSPLVFNTRSSSSPNLNLTLPPNISLLHKQLMLIRRIKGRGFLHLQAKSACDLANELLFPLTNSSD